LAAQPCHREARWRPSRASGIWQLSLFGGLKVAGDEDFPELAFDHWTAATFRSESAPLALDDEEKPDL
jgi:hypothetical protein